MSTIKSKNPTVTDVKELGKGAENITEFEAGAIYSISGVESGADNAIAPLLASMFELGIRGEDWQAKRGHKTTADMITSVGETFAIEHAVEYQERLAWYGKACYTPAEQAIIDAPAPKKTDFTTEGEFLVAQKGRKDLQNRPSDKMKNLAGRLYTLAKNAGEIEPTEKKGADDKKTVQEKLSAPATAIVKLLQGDGRFPEDMDVVEGIELIQAWAKKMNVKIDIK